MKSFDARNKDTFLRNGYYSLGRYSMPFIYKQDIDLMDLDFIGFHNVKLGDAKNDGKTVHFFIDDHKFEAIWNRPHNYIIKLSQYKQVLSPDFSLYTNMPVALQIYNTFRRRWCSAFWQANGLTVIPTVGWGNEESYDFCFDGIEKGSVIAISALGAKGFKDSYLQGFNEMCKRLEPEKIICYCRPFEEMEDKVLYVPHEGETRKTQLQARRVS